MEEDLNVFLNGRRPAGWLAYLALASPELGTAQPQLVPSFSDYFECADKLRIMTGCTYLI